MTDTNQDITQAIKIIVDQIAPAIPISVDLWGTKEIAAFLKVGTRQASIYASHPTFPKPHRLPSTTGKGHRRWKAKDIIAWWENDPANRKSA